MVFFLMIQLAAFFNYNYIIDFCFFSPKNISQFFIFVYLKKINLIKSLGFSRFFKKKH